MVLEHYGTFPGVTRDYSVSGFKRLLWCSEETWTDGGNEGKNEGGSADLASHKRWNKKP